MLRAWIHVIVGPIAASLLLLAITASTDFMFRLGAPGKLAAQTAEIISNLLRPGALLLFAVWALLAWLGMVIADARRPRTPSGVARLMVGALVVGGPGVLALIIYGRNPAGGMLAWAAIGAGALAACRLACRFAGVGPAWRASIAGTSAAILPENRAVFGRRGLT